MGFMELILLAQTLDTFMQGLLPQTRHLATEGLQVTLVCEAGATILTRHSKYIILYLTKTLNPKA